MENQNVSNENRPMYEPQVAKSTDNEIQFKKLKNKEDFYNRLIEFHRHKNVNTPLVNFPTLNGKLIDLKKLYSIVISFGGWERVCEKDKWNDVGLELDSKLFKSCLNGGHALKTIYIRYLSMYEKFDHQMSYGASVSQGASISSLLDPLHNFNHSLPHSMSVNAISSNSGQIDRPSLGYHKGSVPNLDDTLDPDMNRRRFSYLIDLTPMNYSYSQHNPTTGPASSHLHPNPYEKLEISLISGLPNEVDFVFNSMVLMSSEESNSFKIYQSPRLISLVLAHVGFFGEKDKYNLRPLYEHCWFKPAQSDNMNKQEMFENFLSNTDLKLLSEKYEKWTREAYARRDFGKFWHQLVQMPEEDLGQSDILSSILPNKDFGEKHSNILNLTEIRHDLSDPLVPFSVEHKRIEQVLIILNNLSFEDINADFMTKCQVLFEFLIVCLYCSNPVYEIRKHALDILANISRKLKLRFLSERHKRMLLNAMYHLIVGQEEINYSTFENKDETLVSKIVPILDRLELIRGLEILTKLCAQEQLESLADDDFLNNEKVICTFSVEFKNGQNVLLLERIVSRIKEILPVQDLLILLHCLEFMYNISQFNEFICNLIMDCSQDKLISVLVNFLTLDMSHFDVSENSDDQIKMYKIMPSSGQVTSAAPAQQNANQIPQISAQSQNVQKTPSLLQQTLNNQQFSSSIVRPAQAQNLPIRIQPLINSEQQARTILRNWLLTCFQKDPNSELSKTQLYPYYQQISKYNNWPILTIPVFFEILNTTFPHLRYDEETNKLHGLKLVLNLKQQLELKEKFASIRSEPIPSIQHSKINMPESSDQKASEENYTSQLSLSPPPTVSINMPSIGMPLLTPPPPMESSGQSEKTVLPSETNIANTNSCKSKEALNVGDTEMIGQNEDSIMSNSSSSTSGLSASNSNLSNKDLKPDEKANKENNADLKRKIDLKDTIETKALTKLLNESSQDSKSDSSSSSSPIKKKKLKINEMEDFMNKPMAPITIVSNQYSNTIQVQFKNEQINQPILIAQPIVPAQSNQQINQIIPQTAAQQIPQNIQFVQVNQIDQAKSSSSNGSYLCEWNNCNQFFPTAKAVYIHVCKFHLLNNEASCDPEGQLCLWSGCDQIKRQKWSLVNHLQERHCSENAMRNAMICRQQGFVKTVNNPNALSNHLNYSKDAAFFAIQRHHRLKKEDFISQQEGPITKSIRLLSALILRNLARNSQKAKRTLQNYESQLAVIAFDLLESSGAVSSCLWHLNH